MGVEGGKHVKMVLNHPHCNTPFYLELSTDALCHEERVRHISVNQGVSGNDTLVACLGARKPKDVILQKSRKIDEEEPVRKRKKKPPDRIRGG